LYEGPAAVLARARRAGSAPMVQRAGRPQPTYINRGACAGEKPTTADPHL
jgi:hypothetical protein